MYQLTEEESMIVDMVDRLCRDVISERAAQIDEDDKFPHDIFDLLKEQGIFAVSFDEAYGGFDTSIHCWVRIIERVARESPAVALMILINAVGTDPVVSFGTEEQKRTILTRLTAGEAKACFALTEPNAGSDISSIRTTAKKIDGGYCLNGSKIFITNGAVGDYFSVFAQVDDGIDRKPTCFIVSKDTPGLVIGRKEEKMGLRGSVTSQLFFENMVVPETSIIGEVGQGFEVAHHTLNRGRLAVAALAEGVARASLDYAANYALERVQFGRHLSEMQAIRHMIADMEVGVEAGTLLLDQAASDYQDNSKNLMKHASAAKLYCSELAVRNSEAAVQIFGGYGVCKDYPVERFYRDAKFFTIVEGTSQVQRTLVAKAVLKEHALES